MTVRRRCCYLLHAPCSHAPCCARTDVHLLDVLLRRLALLLFRILDILDGWLTRTMLMTPAALNHTLNPV